MRVLVVDDDADFRLFLTTSLETMGSEVREAVDAAGALAALEEPGPAGFDIMLLDVEMPGMLGWELLAEVRAKGDEVPVIFVTGRESTADRVRGLRLGGDDYVVKPIEFEELSARIEAVLRRRRSLPSIEFGDVTLDLAKRRAFRAGKAVHLSPKEFDLLRALVEGGGEVLSRAKLLEDVWDMTFDPQTNLLDVHIGRMRRKIDRFGRPLIETVRGEGYRAVRRDAADT